MERLTSRERVQRAINHQEADRVPIDIGGTKVTGIHVDEYVELVKHIGMDLLPPKVYDQFQMLARVDESMMRWLHTDVVEVENLIETWGLKNENWKIWTTHPGNDVLMPGNFNPIADDSGRLYLRDASGNNLAFMGPTAIYFDRACSTEMRRDDYPFITPEEWKESIPLYGDEELNVIEKRAKFLHENTDYSLHGGFLKGGLGTNGIFAGHTIGDWLRILVSEKQYAYAILEATAERAIENLRLYLQAVGRYIDTILISGTDFGTQKGELLNPALFRELHMPNYRRICDYVHRNSTAKTMLHSCGSIYRLLPHLVEAGIDILNPVHTNTANMAPERLKREFGDKLVFWGGGIETQTVLPHGSPDEVREQVRARLRILAPNGGFVFTPVHNIQYGVPPENIEAMIETVVTDGLYPIRALS